MSHGVVFKMGNFNALISIAMLSVFLSKESKGYLDLISPFVLNLLPKSIGDIVDEQQILNELKENYGFEDMPIGVLQRILTRYCREGYLVKDSKMYIIKKVYDSTKFTENRRSIKKSIDEVVKSLGKYLNKKKILENQEKSFKVAHDRLVKFFETYGFNVINDIGKLQFITHKTDRDNYYVARFILDEYEKKSEVFYKISEIIKGFFVYKAIYFFSSNQKKEFNSKIKKTTVYLDTRLLINALGYNTLAEEKSAKELINLIQDNGGIVKTFTHNKDEVAGILTKYARDPLSRNSLSLEYFNLHSYDGNDAIRLRESLVINLRKIGIEVVDTPEYGVVEDDDLKNKGFLDLEGLKQQYKDALSRQGKSAKENTIENDIESISAISRIRGKARTCSIEECKAIFVTTNYFLVNLVRHEYKERFSKGEINFAISDIDIISLLWLKNFDKKTDLPSLILLENAYAACCPSEEVMQSFVKKVEELNERGLISKEEALIMRYETTVGFDVVEISGNNPSLITENTILEIKEKLKEQYISNERNTIKKLTYENNEFKARKDKAILQANEDAKVISNKFGKIIYWIFIIFFIALTISSVIITVVDSELDKKYSLFALTIGILGILDLFMPKFNVIKKLSSYSKQHWYNRVYNKKIDEINKYFSL